MTKRIRGVLDDRLLGVLGVVIGLALLVLTPYAVRSSTMLIPGTDILFIRGDFYPRVTAGLLVVVGSWLAVSDAFRRSRGRGVEVWPGQETTRAELKASVIFIAGTAVYAFVVINVGFVVGSAVAFFLLARALGGPTLWSLGLAIASSLVMELVFGRFFGIPLPGRILG